MELASQVLGNLIKYFARQLMTDGYPMKAPVANGSLVV